MTLIGVNLPQYAIDFEAGTSIDAAVAYAVEAERVGLHSVWVSDHPFVVAPDGSRWEALDPAALVLEVARATSRITIGTLVLAASRRGTDDVDAFANAAHDAARGRFVLGVGAGWYEPEFRALGRALPPLGERVDELRRVLERVRGVPVLVGGTHPRVLELAAEHATWWNMAWDPPVEAFADVRGQLQRRATARGRDVLATVGVTAALGDEAEIAHDCARVRARAPFLDGVTPEALRSHIIVGSVADARSRIGAYGAALAIVTPLVRDDARALGTVAALG